MQSSSNPATLEQLLAEHEWLSALARRIAGDAEAGDLVQDVWVTALEKSPEARAGLRPWLAGVVRNLGSGRRRERARRGEREQRSARLEALPSTLELVERLDTERRLASALLALDEPYRTTLLLRFHEGLAAAEIARRQGVPEGTVRWRAKQGIDRLREELTQEYGDRAALGLALAPVIHCSGVGAATAAGAALMGGTKGMAAALLAAGALTTWWWMQRDAETRALLVAAAGETRATLAAVSEVTEEAEAALTPVESSEALGASQRSVAGSALTRLRVLECDGRPNAELNVVLAPLPGEHDALAHLTDAQGWVEFLASGEHRAMVVERLNAFQFRSELELVPGESTLTLPEPAGADLAGRVLVDGEVPSKALWFVLYAASSERITIDTSDVGCLLAGDVTYAQTDAQGRFRFRGLTPGRGLNLRAPEGFVRPGTAADRDLHEEPIEHFEGPAEGVVIELEALPRVHGRVLEADGVTPAAKVGIEIDMTGGIWGRDTQPDGTFEIFSREPPTRLSVRIEKDASGHTLHGASPDGTAREFNFPEPQRDTDLGDLVLAPSTGAFVVVRAPSGEPLAGAEVGVVTSRPTNATEADGRTWMGGLAAGNELAITRRGYRTAFMTLPDPVPGTVAVELQPTNDLCVEVRGVGGEPVEGIQLELSAPQEFVPREEPGSEAWLRYSGGHGAWWFSWPRNRAFEGRRGNVWGGSPARIQFSTDRTGRVSMGELLPEIALHLSVRDDSGWTLLEQDLAAFGAEERRVVPVQLTVPLEELHGRVVSESGEPIARAEVNLTRSGAADGQSRETDSDGRFRFRHVLRGDLRLTAKKHGFLAREFTPVRSSDEELELVLTRGADVIVRVVDGAGAPVGGGRVRARSALSDERCEGELLGEGRYELVGLTPREHDVELALPAGVLRATWTPPEAEVVFVVPDRGTLELSWNLTRDDPNAVGYHVRLEPSGGEPAQEHHLDTTPRGGWRSEEFVGDYALVLVVERPLPDGGRRGEDLERRALSVRTGETVRVELGP